MSPRTSASHPVNNWFCFPNLPSPPGTRGWDETNQEMLIKENPSPWSFLLQAEGYKVILSNVVIFSLFPALVQCIPISHRDSSTGRISLRGGGGGGVKSKSLLPTSQESDSLRVRTAEFGRALENLFPILLLPLSWSHTNTYIHVCVCVCVHTQTDTLTLEAPRIQWLPKKDSANESAIPGRWCH